MHTCDSGADRQPHAIMQKSNSMLQPCTAAAGCTMHTLHTYSTATAADQVNNHSMPSVVNPHHHAACIGQLTAGRCTLFKT